MKVAIIGSGNVGKAVASSCVRAGFNPTLSAADPEHAQQAAATTGASAAGSNRAAVRDADMVVIAVGYSALDSVLADLDGALDGKIVVDAINPMAPDMQGLAGDRSVAEQIQARVPGARVVKALNTAFASRQANPDVDGTPVDGYYAGDDEQAKQAVAEFLRTIGFRPVDLGSLKMARGLEWLALLNISLQIRSGGSWQAGWKIIEPSPVAV